MMLLTDIIPLPGRVPRRVCEKAPLLAYWEPAPPPAWLRPMNMRYRCREADPIERVPNTPWDCRIKIVGNPWIDWFIWLPRKL